MTTYQSSSTVKLTVNFAGSDDVAFNPDSIDSLKILKPDKSVLDTYTNDEWTQEATGIYYMYYTLPECTCGHVYHEWSYTYNSVSDLIRGRIDLAYI